MAIKQNGTRWGAIFVFALKPLRRKFAWTDKKTKDSAFRRAFCFAELVSSVVLLSNNLGILVVTASLAYAVCKIVLAALRALYKVGGRLKFPNAGASFHLS